MARNILDYENSQIEKSKQQQAEYESKRNQQANDYYKQVESALTQQGANKQNEINKRIDGVPEKYRPQYDKNAVNELVQRRQYAEDAANSGMSNSGAHRLWQTSAGLQRQKADTDTRLEQQAAVDALQQEIQNYLNDIALQKQQKAAEIYNGASSDILNNNTLLYNSAMSNAGNLYGVDVRSDDEAANRAIQEQIAQAQLAEQRRAAEAQLSEQRRAAAAQEEYARQKLIADRENAEKNRQNNLYASLVSQGVSPSEAKIMLYGSDSEKRSLAYRKSYEAIKQKNPDMSDEEISQMASKSSIEQVYGKNQSDLLRAFRELN